MKTKPSAKYRGMKDAPKWCYSTTPMEIIRVAGYNFQFNIDSLEIMRKQGYNVPDSPDKQYSWGFWKQVKDYACHQIWNRQKIYRNNSHFDSNRNTTSPNFSVENNSTIGEKASEKPTLEAKSLGDDKLNWSVECSSWQ